MQSGVYFNGIPLSQYLRLRELKELENWKSEYAWLDPDACHAMYMRMADAASTRRLLNYRELANGVTFKAGGPEPVVSSDGRISFEHRITYSTRAFLEDFVIYITAATFRDGEVLIGSIVRDEANLGQVAVSLQDWAQLVGIQNRSNSASLSRHFWNGEADKTFDLYGSGDWRQA